MLKLALVSTTEQEDGHLQKWLVTDGDEVHEVETLSEWGDVQVLSGADRVYNVGGTAICAGKLVAANISSVCSVVTDGDESQIDESWIESVLDSGYPADSLVQWP